MNPSTAALVAAIIQGAPVAVSAILQIIEAARQAASHDPAASDALKAKLEALKVSLAQSAALTHEIAQAVAEDRTPA